MSTPKATARRTFYRAPNLTAPQRSREVDCTRCNGTGHFPKRGYECLRCQGSKVDPVRDWVFPQAWDAKRIDAFLKEDEAKRQAYRQERAQSRDIEQPQRGPERPRTRVWRDKEQAPKPTQPRDLDAAMRIAESQRRLHEDAAEPPSQAQLKFIRDLLEACGYDQDDETLYPPTKQAASLTIDELKRTRAALTHGNER